MPTHRTYTLVSTCNISHGKSRATERKSNYNPLHNGSQNFTQLRELFQLRNNATIFVHLHSTVYIVYNNTTDGMYNHIRHSSLTSPVSVIDSIDIAKELLIDIDKGKSIDSTTLVGRYPKLPGRYRL